MIHCQIVLLRIMFPFPTFRLPGKQTAFNPVKNHTRKPYTQIIQNTAVMKKLTLIIATLLFLIDHNKAQIVNIIDFGAVPDGLTVNTACIQMAIDSVSTHGGGTVYVPSGVFITGTFELKSNINLFLETGAEIKEARILMITKYLRQLISIGHIMVLFIRIRQIIFPLQVRVP